MRILATFGGTSVAGGISGGDRYGLEIMNAWNRSGRGDVRLSTTTFGREICERFGYRLPLEVFERRSRPIGPWRLGYIARCLKQLRLLARCGAADWGYSFSPFYYDALPLVVLRVLGRVKFLIVPVFHLTPPPFERGWKPQNVPAWLENRLMLHVLRLTRSTIVTDNATVVADLVTLGFQRQNILLSAMGVVERRCEDGVDEGEPLDCIYVGRLATTKGVELLLTAWSNVLKALPRARLALVGSRDADLDIDRCMENLDLPNDRVQVFEGLSDAQVQGLFKRSTCFATASPEEGYCLAVAEAMRDGLPCVTFDLPAFRLIYPHGRQIVMERTPEAFAQALVVLLCNEALRVRLISQIQEHCQFRSWSEVADDLLNRCIPAARAGGGR